jgi:hypothetical protein
MMVETEITRAALQTNKTPLCKWRGEIMACGTRRQRLVVDGNQTPFFIDSAMGVLAHRTQGDEHGLFGSGMGPSNFNRHGLRSAAILGSGRNIAVLKHRAEQMAFSSLETRI